MRKKGYKIGVATLKSDRFANIMLEKFGIKDLFDTVHGVDDNDKLDKSSLIQLCVFYCGLKNKDAILVGDSINDYNGSICAHVDFLGF